MRQQTLAYTARFIQERFMTQRCDHLRRISAQNPVGGATYTYTTLTQDLPCRVLPLTRLSRDQATSHDERESLEDEYKLILPPDTVIEVDDRLLLDGVTYEVIALRYDDLTEKLYTQVTVLRVRG